MLEIPKAKSTRNYHIFSKNDLDVTMDNQQENKKIKIIIT
jgi:hypothetical protein